MSDQGQDLPNLNHLRWQCRRGMLELDYVLRRYLDERYEAAPLAERQQFVALLAMQDQDLLAWLIHDRPPQDSAWLPIIHRVRGDR